MCHDVHVSKSAGPVMVTTIDAVMFHCNTTVSAFPRNQVRGASVIAAGIGNGRFHGLTLNAVGIQPQIMGIIG